MMKRVSIVLALILICSVSAMSMSMKAQEDNPTSMIGTINFMDSAGIEAGVITPSGILKNLYILGDLKYAPANTGLAGRLVYILPLTHGFFVAPTGGVDWMKLAQDDAPMPAYWLTASGVCFGKEFNKWGLFGHWEYITPIDKDGKARKHHILRFGAWKNF